MSDQDFIKQALELINDVEVESVEDLSGNRDDWQIFIKNHNAFYELTLIEDSWEITTNHNEWIDTISTGFEGAVAALSVYLLELKIEALAENLKE